MLLLPVSETGGSISVSPGAGSLVPEAVSLADVSDVLLALVVLTLVLSGAHGELNMVTTARSV
jgi:hypothetical protein